MLVGRGQVMFVIEDDLHGDTLGNYDTFEDALTQLRAWALLPWDQDPNLAPCTSWRTCGRSYQIVEYDSTVTPWKRINTTEILEVDARGVKWADGFQP